MIAPTQEIMSPDGEAYDNGYRAFQEGKPRTSDAPEHLSEHWLEGWDQAQADGPFDEDE